MSQGPISHSDPVQSEADKATGSNPSEAKQDATPAAYKLPDLSGGAASFFDAASMTYWIGIPVNKMDALFALAVIDSAKIDILRKYQMLHSAAEAAKKIVRPGLRGLVDRATGILKS